MMEERMASGSLLM
uniref:Uncharacterized protein n=1 Tax=Arundo donax TaxID=35708 RepID=A0A0A9BGJ6_ARUDO